jgi:phosphoenolpyruvate-protein kinase (PTS system EI component)
LQSAIDEGRLKFRDQLDTGGHTSHSQILSKGVINIEGKILVRPSQAETTKGKNIIIDESRETVKPTTKKLKPTFDELSAKYKKGNAHTKSR